jgi:hypothetical protein
MFQTTGGHGAAMMRGLYGEFSRYYMAERCRCPWAPVNPRRVFNLAFDVVYPRFSELMSEEEFLGAVYEVLGFPGSRPRGLFDTFAPSKYHGTLPLQDHFVNLFKLKLEWRVKDWLRQRDRESRPLMRNEGSRYDRIHQERVDALQEGLGLLSQDEATIVWLEYWGRYSHRELAVELKLDRETIRRRHGMAIGKLREYFGIFWKSAA